MQLEAMQTMRLLLVEKAFTVMLRSITEVLLFFFGACLLNYLYSFFVSEIQGEKNNGFDVLYHNMKHGQISSKELTDFIRER